MKLSINRRNQTPPLGGWGAVYFLFLLLSASCKSNDTEPFASGYFEAVETIVSAQANGSILELNISEGQELVAGEKVGQIDSTQIFLTIRQVQSQKGAVLSRKPDISSQTAILKEQLIQANRELQRVGMSGADGPRGHPRPLRPASGPAMRLR